MVNQVAEKPKKGRRPLIRPSGLRCAGIMIHNNDYTELCKIADERGITTSAVIREAVKMYLENLPEEARPAV